MTFQVNACVTSEGSSSRRGPDEAGHPAYTSFVMGAGGGQPAVRLYTRKIPVIQHLNKSSGGKPRLSGFLTEGSPNVARDERLPAERSHPEEDPCGRHFLFDKKCGRLERTRTVIPPLLKDHQAPRPGNLHPFNLSREISNHSRAGRPFTLGCPETFELNASPAILFPSPLVFNVRNNFSTENYNISRPKLKYPPYIPRAVRDSHRNPSYPDPMVGASRSFIHRISELSSLEGETVRQEKLKKLRKARKLSS